MKVLRALASFVFVVVFMAAVMVIALAAIIASDRLGPTYK